MAGKAAVEVALCFHSVQGEAQEDDLVDKPPNGGEVAEDLHDRQVATCRYAEHLRPRVAVRSYQQMALVSYVNGEEEWGVQGYRRPEGDQEQEQDEYAERM